MSSKRRTSKEPYKKPYTQNAVDKALEDIQNGVSVRKAAEVYGVPRSTLQAKNTFQIPVEARRGPSSYLRADEEQVLVSWILWCGKRGFPITKSQLLSAVQSLVAELDRETPFKDKKPERHWYEAFCRRHPEISERVCQNLSNSRASASEEKLRNWFKEVEDHLKKVELMNIDPSQVFNMD